MSRIGNKPVAITPDVKVAVADGVVNVEGKLGKLSFTLPPHVGATVEGSEVHVKCLDETDGASALHGLSRSLINNMVIGVSQGYRKEAYAQPRIFPSDRIHDSRRRESHRHGWCQSPGRRDR